MANEFKIKNGYLAEGDSQITGSLTVTGGITGSFQGTATTASFVTASNVVGTVTSASYAQTASLASFALSANTAGTASEANSIATAITDNTDNNILTATGTGTINGEGSLTFDGNKLTAQSSFAQGGGKANGNYSHAEGESSEANGNYSHAEGFGTFAGSSQGYIANSITNGTCSLEASYGDISAEYTSGDSILFDDTVYDGAYGLTTFIVDDVTWDTTNTIVTLTDPSVTTTTAIIGNITYGVKNWAGGYPIGGHYSHAEGKDTYAIGQYSHAEGDGTQAIGVASHAEGKGTQAIGDFSHAEGYSTIASGPHQHVSGQYNTHGDTTSLFIVGNGVGNATRSDAFKVTTSGSIVLPTTVSSTPGWTGVQGEMVFGDNSSGTYRIVIWLNGGWRSVSLA
jgi:hypothetical protein